MQNESKLHKLFFINQNQIKKDIDNSKFKNSLKCLCSKTEQIIKLKEDTHNSIHFYTSQILLRSLIEHFLIGFYVFLRIRIDKTDEVGIEYYDFYQNSEYLKQETYSIQIDDIKNNNKGKLDADRLKQKFPYLNNLEQKDLQDYHSEGSKFTNIKNIGKYIIENKNFEPNLKKISEIIVDLIDQYNYLSSYVHGGPFAERELSEMKESEIKEFRKKTLGWADVLSKIIIDVLFLSLTYEKPKIYKPIFSESLKK